MICQRGTIMASVDSVGACRFLQRVSIALAMQSAVLAMIDSV